MTRTRGNPDDARWFLGARRALGMTQLELAERLDVCDVTISNYERGHTQVPRAVMLACMYLMTNGPR